MQDYSDYRETPRTGRTPEYSGHELDPEHVDPSVLTDDRDNPDLLTFERTWGHRLLAGIGVAMLVVAAVLDVFCIIQLTKVSDVALLSPEVGTIAYFLYGTGLACGILVIPPAIIAIYVAKHPKYVAVAIAAAIIAIAGALVFFIYALTSTPQYTVTALLYTVLLCVFPVIYLIAALKIKRSL